MSVTGWKFQVFPCAYEAAQVQCPLPGTEERQLCCTAESVSLEGVNHPVLPGKKSVEMRFTGTV